ncbi:hypothetical protein GBAR_LOCUS24896, partial [Geodia barretti]
SSCKAGHTRGNFIASTKAAATYKLKYHTEQTTDSSADSVGCTVHDNGLHAGDTRLGNEWRDATWSIVFPHDCVYMS